MDHVAKISQAAPSVSNAVIINAMAVLCGLAVVMFACIATYGIDMSVGFF